MTDLNPTPTTDLLCGTFVEPATRDPGRSFSAALKPSCAAPTDVVIDGQAEIVYVNGEPQAIES